MSPILRDEMTDAERAERCEWCGEWPHDDGTVCKAKAVVAKGHCKYCGDYVEPAAKKRHGAFCALVVEMAARREGEKS